MTRTVFVSGNFNVIHPGHLRLFRFARELGDRLIVGVQSDRLAGDASHVAQDLRLEGVESISFVDQCFLFDEEVVGVIGRLRPDVVVKGNEHEGHSNSEAAVLAEYGGQLIFSSGEAVFSSVDLLKRDLDGEKRMVGFQPTDYLDRHGIKADRILSIIEQFNGLGVCVVGDLIVDEYVTCDALGMSQEDPTVVVTPVDTERFVGGAGVVAAHAAGLGGNVHFLSVSGQDDMREFVLADLEALGVNSALFADDTRPTTRKQRFRADGMTLLRVSHLHQGSIHADLQDRVFGRFKEVVDECSLLVFSDFNYGCLPQSLVDRIMDVSRSAGLFVAADSQSSSQIGNVARFKGVDLLTPTEHEARVSLRDQEDGLVVLVERLRVESSARHIILKMGEEGALLHLEGSDGDYHTDRIPSLNQAPRDVIGAGDSLLISSSMALAAGATPWEAAYIGSVAAAIQVARLGNTPLSPVELRREIQ
jgi:rfaE bifunctional protein kinase chain/domain